MEIPIRPFRVEILFNEFMENLEKVHGWNYRDMAGKYKWQQETRERLCAEHNIDYKVWSHKVPSDMTIAESEFRVIYNAEMEKAPPYHDAWHWLSDRAFDVTGNGCSVQLSSEYVDPELAEEFDDVPEYVMTVISAIFNAVPEDHPARDEDGINFYIYW